VTDPVGGEQPAVNAGSATFPLDVAAAWTADRHTLTVAVLNPTDGDQALKLNIAGASLAGKGALWRLAPSGDDIQNPVITSSPVDAIPDTLTLPRYSISIYELAAKQ
jgi:alpha-N-arabinofuranosidase